MGTIAAYVEEQGPMRSFRGKGIKTMCIRIVPVNPAEKRRWTP